MVFVFDIVILSDKYEQIMNFRTFIVDFHKLYEINLKFLCIFTNQTSLTRLRADFKSALSDPIRTGSPASAFSSEYAQDTFQQALEKRPESVHILVRDPVL